MSAHSLRPSDLSPGEVVACIGLVADTHAADLLQTMPPALPTIFKDVDLIIHAGDVGAWWALDQISNIAPVIAVRGNADGALDQMLPLDQIVTVGGQRLAVWHSHFLDPAEERAARAEPEAWQPKLARYLAHAHERNATILVVGHTHVPMVYTQDGVLVINPGAVVPGKFFERSRQTVALLYVCRDRTPVVVHVDLAQPDQPFVPQIDWQAGFRAALAQHSSPIVAPDLLALRQPLIERVYPFAPDALRALVLPLARRCWHDPQARITRADLLAALHADAAFPADARAALQAVLHTPLEQADDRTIVG